MPLPGGWGGGIKGWLAWGVHLTKDWPDPKADQLSCWPEVVPLLTTRCLYWGWGHRGLGLHLKNEDGSFANWKHTSELRWTGPNLVALLAPDATTGGTSVLRSTGPNLVPLLATRCHYWEVCLTKGQGDPKADQISSWPNVVLLVATGCLY